MTARRAILALSLDWAWAFLRLLKLGWPRRRPQGSRRLQEQERPC